jgi:hypothetical protein
MVGAAAGFWPMGWAGIAAAPPLRAWPLTRCSILSVRTRGSHGKLWPRILTAPTAPCWTASKLNRVEDRNRASVLRIDQNRVRARSGTVPRRNAPLRRGGARPDPQHRRDGVSFGCAGFPGQQFTCHWLRTPWPGDKLKLTSRCRSLLSSRMTNPGHRRCFCRFSESL